MKKDRDTVIYNRSVRRASAAYSDALKAAGVRFDGEAAHD